MVAGSGVFHGLAGENGVVPRLRTGIVDGPAAGALPAVEVPVGVAGCVGVVFGVVVGSLIVVGFVVEVVVLLVVDAAVVDGFVPADEVLGVAVVLFVVAAGRVGVVVAFAGVVEVDDARFTVVFRRPLARWLRFDAFVERRRADRR